MKEEWEKKKLGDVANYINGYAFKPTDWEERGFKIIRIQNLNNPDAPYNYCNRELPEKYKVHNGDLLISWSASLGAYIWNYEEAYLNQHIFKVEFGKSNIDKSYLKYVVDAKLEDMSKNAHGATMKHIVKKDFDNTIISVPPIATQKAIVSELDNLSSIISRHKQLAEEYDHLEQSIFYDMFGDPVSNEKGWEVKKLGDVAESTIGLTYKPENIDDNGTVVLRSGNIQNSELAFDDIVRVNSNIPEYKYVKEGDILMCTRNGSFRLVGKVAMIKGLKERMTYGAFMTIIRSIHNPYLYGYFKTPAFRQHLVNGKTSTVNQITVKMLNDIMLPLPPLQLQTLFAQKIQHIESLKAKNSKAQKEAELLFAERMNFYFGE